MIGSVDGMAGNDAGENIGEVSPIVDAAFVAGEESAFARKSLGTDSAFNNIGAQFDSPVVEEASEAAPMPERIAEIHDWPAE